MLNVILALYVISLNPKLSTLLSHSSKPSTSGRGDKESTSLGHCENFRRSRLVSPYYRPGQNTSAVPVGHAMLLCHQQLHKWRNKLQLFLSCHIPRCYNHKDVKVVSMQLHCLSDASQMDYAGVVYLRMIDEQGDIHTSLVISETKVAPVIRSTIVWSSCNLSTIIIARWCLVFLLIRYFLGLTARLARRQSMPVQDLCWKESVAGHRAHLTQAWRHNSVDRASHGLLSTELLENELRWSGPGYSFILAMLHGPSCST